MKKLLSAILSLAMICSATGCTNSPPSSAESSAAPQTEAVNESAAAESKEMKAVQKYDFSSVPIQTTDKNYPNGAVFYSDISDIVNKVSVEDRPLKIGFVMKTLVNEYWSTVKEGIENEVARMQEAGISVEVDIQAGASDSDKEGQLAILRSMINSKYDVIVVCPISDANLTPGIEEAIAADIPIVSMNTYFDSDPYVPYYIGASFFAQGQVAAEWIAKNNPNGGKVAVIMGLADAASSIGCTDGFKSWVETNTNSGLEIVDIQSADWDRVRAQDITATLLKQNPDLKAIFCLNDVMAIGSVEAVKQAGKLDQVKVIGRDGNSEAIESIKNKELSATVGQFPYYMGKASLQVALLAEQNVELPERIWITNAIIDQSNYETNEADVLGWKDVEYEVIK